MDRLALAAAVVAVAALVAFVVARKKPAPPTQPRWSAPQQLDRADFDRPEAPWLVAVFTSATCDSCATAMEKAGVLASADVAVCEVEARAQADIHQRYGIEAVPITVVADSDGVVRASFVGPASATDLWAAVAEARYPNSSPEPGLGRPAS
jgi:hypothetical protein